MVYPTDSIHLFRWRKGVSNISFPFVVVVSLHDAIRDKLSAKYSSIRFIDYSSLVEKTNSDTLVVMEQNLINTSRFRISSLSIDSRFADSTFNDSGSADFMIRLPSTLRNIMRIRLSSVELPLVEYVFSESHGNIQFVVEIGGSQTTLTIPSGNYDPSGFCSAIQTALRTVDNTFSCGINPLTGCMTIRRTSGGGAFTLLLSYAPYSARKTFWGIGYNMGFRTKTVVADISGTVGYAVAPSLVLTRPNPYVLLQLRCPDQLENITHRIYGNSSIPAFAKLVLRGDSFVAAFDDNANLLRKEYTFLAPSNMTTLYVRLVDPFGDTVSMFDMNWSMTLEVTEVVNSNVYAAIGQTYSS